MGTVPPEHATMRGQKDVQNDDDYDDEQVLSPDYMRQTNSKLISRRSINSATQSHIIIIKFI